MEHSEDLIRKLRKLMALADPSRGATEAEALVATQKMNALLAEHSIDLATLPGERDERGDIVEETVEASATRAYKWARWLYQSCAELNYCTYFFYRNSRVRNKSGRLVKGIKHCVAGRQASVIVARETAEYLLATVYKLALAAGKVTHPGATREDGSIQDYYRYVDSFCEGAATRLCQRIAQLIADAKAGKARNVEGTANLPALASLYDSEKQALTVYMKAQHANCKTSKERQSQHDYSAYGDGVRAGDAIGLDRQLGGSNGTQRRLQ